MSESERIFACSLFKVDSDTILSPYAMREYALHLAVEAGDLFKVKSLLRNCNSCPINRPGKTKKYRNIIPLYIAIIFDHRDILKLLLNNPSIDVNTRFGADPETVLHRTVKECGWSKLWAIEVLLQVPKIDVNYVDRYGRTAVNITAYEEIAIALCTSGGDCRVGGKKFFQKCHYETKREWEGILPTATIRNICLQSKSTLSVVAENQDVWNVIEFDIRMPKFVRI